MKIYTKAGDEGETGLFGGVRVRKDDARVEAYGTLDELNSTLGAARAGLPAGSPLTPILDGIQHDLFDLGAELATPSDRLETKLGERVPRVTNVRIAELESEIDRFEVELQPLQAFILPGGAPEAAALHVARAVCRRAERRTVTLGKLTPIRPETVQYLNRLSDVLFVVARYANRLRGIADIPWH